MMRRNRPGYESAAAILSMPGSEYGKTRERISYCAECLNVNVLSPLKDRIYLDENGKITSSPGPDADKWRQCWTCGTIVGIYEAKQEPELTSLTEPTDNPFKFGSGGIHGGESRRFDRTCKTQRKKQFKRDLEQYKEEDIKEALRKGSKLVSFTEY